MIVDTCVPAPTIASPRGRLEANIGAEKTASKSVALVQLRHLPFGFAAGLKLVCTIRRAALATFDPDCRAVCSSFVGTSGVEKVAFFFWRVKLEHVARVISGANLFASAKRASQL